MKAKSKSTAVEIELRIALRYALFGGLWILLSDRLLEALITDTATLSKLQTYKGWAFVAISALLIFSLLRQELALRRAAETDLHESEERYRLLFEHSIDAIIFSLPDDTAYAANPAACRMFGWSEQEFKQLRRADIVDATDPRLPLALEERKLTGSFQGELTFIRRDGTKFPAEISSMVFKDKRGEDRVSTILRDITERKQAQEGLRRYELLSVHSRDIILFINRHDGRILEANAAAELAYGYSRDELLTLTIRDLRAPASRSVATDQMAQADAHGILFETTHMRRDGSKFPAEVSSQGVNIGDVRTLMSIIRDITDRKQAEDELRENERQLRALVTSMDDIVFEFDEHGTYLNIWTGNESLLARPKSQLLGHTMVEILGEEAGSLSTDALQRVIQSGVPETIEYPLTVIEGQRWFLARISPIPDSGGTNRTASMLVRDITKRKQAEDELRILNDRLEQRVVERTQALHQANIELEHANRAKDEFLATMSHELRTPLNSILGLSEMLLEERRGSINDYQQKSLQMIETSGQHLLELINDILDLSKIEAGKLDYHPQLVSVDDVCRSSLMFIASQAARKNITITYQNESSFARISADARRLKQILVNLLTNAVKFTSEHGHVILQVGTKVEQDLIQFSVIDDGVGIAPENLKRLFKPFVQVDSSLSRQYEGTGLGLALVQKLTDLHGGSVHVESEIGKGSRFTINLNCSQDSASDSITLNSVPNLSAAPQMEKQGISRQDSARRGVILLAEDNLPNILTIGEYLESYGYQVLVARDGWEALAKAEEFNPDLILMDIQMPVMNGLEAIARLRAKSRFVSTPIIALTALAMPGDRERCLQAGANEYLSKPVSLKMLVTTISARLHPAENVSRSNPASGIRSL